MEDILLDDSMKKCYLDYIDGFFPVSPPLVAKCNEQWVEEVLDLGGEEWNDMWSVSFTQFQLEIA